MLDDGRGAADAQKADSRQEKRPRRNAAKVALVVHAERREQERGAQHRELALVERRRLHVTSPPINTRAAGRKPPSGRGPRCSMSFRPLVTLRAAPCSLASSR